MKWTVPMALGRRGTAAVEFAIILPVLILLLLGTSQILTLYRTEAKLNQLAGNVAQMVAVQSSPVTAGVAGTLGDICLGAVYGLQPFPPRGLTVAIASVTQESATGATGAYDVWEADNSCGANAKMNTGATATAISTAAATALATTGAGGHLLIAPCDNVIIVRATLTYPGLIGNFIPSPPTLTQTAFARWRTARVTDELKCSGAGCAVAPGAGTAACPPAGG